jgi:hypothetical protein
LTANPLSQTGHTITSGFPNFFELELVLQTILNHEKEGISKLILLLNLFNGKKVPNW